MANPYVGSSITGCNSPAVGADKDTFSGVLDTAAQALDDHDHTPTKGKPIGTAALADAAVTAAKLSDGAVQTAKIGDAQVTLAKLAAEITATLIPAGAVLPYAGTGSAPTGYLMCDGSSLLRASYPNLFAAVGTAHGAADASHFNLPDYRGRFLRGTDNGAGHDPDAAGRTAASTGGATGDAVGSVQADQYGSHAHGVTDPGHAHTLGVVCNQIGAGGGGNILTNFSNAQGTTGATTGVSIQNAGGNETRPKNAGVNYIIKT